MLKLALALALGLAVTAGAQENQWVEYVGGDGPGAGKRVVLISGDEEYRSEEALVQLAKILSERHGFDCRVVFPIDPETGIIQPNFQQNIPGLDALEQADLMIIATRFRNLPDAQMRHIDNYLRAGKPVIGLRTATHAFQFPEDSPWAHYSNSYAGEKTEWTDGFGRLVLGEKWISHHGEHKHESTRGVIAPGADEHPILRGIGSGDIWGPTDVYGVRLPLPGDSQPLVLGEVVARAGEYDEADIFFGMRPEDTTPVTEKNDPMMPVAWTKTYKHPDGEPGEAFATTMGAATDLLNDGLRKLLVNAAYWCVGLEDAIPEDGADAALVGTFEPTQYGFHDDRYWKDKGLRPEKQG